MRNYLILLKKMDWLLVLAVVILICFGLAAIYSLTLNQESPDFTNFNKQTIFTLIGLFCLLVFTIIDYRIFRSYSLPLFIIGGILLLLVLVFGATIKGSTAWFEFFGQTFQPIEVAKITLILFLSKYFSDHYTEMYRFKEIVISLLIALPYIVLTVLQPDFGSAIILIIIWLGLLLLNKTRRTHILIILAVFLVCLLISWLFLFEDYQKERILTFFNPSRDPLGSGYNPTQSIIAVGSGMIFGRGLGLGPQSQLNFLPVAEKDFIFAVIAEELGFIGALILLSFFFLLFYRLLKTLRASKNNFSLFLVSGVIISVFSQTFINISGNIGLLPITGVPLPLLSYGGSALISTLIMFGIVMSIVVRQKS